MGFCNSEYIVLMLFLINFKAQSYHSEKLHSKLKFNYKSKKLNYFLIFIKLVFF